MKVRGIERTYTLLGTLQVSGSQSLLFSHYPSKCIDSLRCAINNPNIIPKLPWAYLIHRQNWYFSARLPTPLFLKVYGIFLYPMTFPIYFFEEMVIPWLYSSTTVVGTCLTLPIVTIPLPPISSLQPVRSRLSLWENEVFLLKSLSEISKDDPNIPAL